jgi:hypothetical protein
VQLGDQGLGEVLPPLDLVDHGRNRRPQRASAGEGIRLAGRDADVVHAKTSGLAVR